MAMAYAYGYALALILVPPLPRLTCIVMIVVCPVGYVIRYAFIHCCDENVAKHNITTSDISSYDMWIERYQVLHRLQPDIIDHNGKKCKNVV